MIVETRFVQAYLELQVRQARETGLKRVPLVRYGAYEVGLVAGCRPLILLQFWLELFDHQRAVSIDSGGADDFETALQIAKELVSDAQELSREQLPKLNG